VIDEQDPKGFDVVVEVRGGVAAAGDEERAAQCCLERKLGNIQSHDFSCCSAKGLSCFYMFARNR
jgi:hypothetical protein